MISVFVTIELNQAERKQSNWSAGSQHWKFKMNEKRKYIANFKHSFLRSWTCLYDIWKLKLILRLAPAVPAVNIIYAKFTESV